MTTHPPWLLDERASIGRENLDTGHVARYDEKEDGDADGEVALLAAAGVAPDATVIDLGAGTGQFALAAVAHGWDVTAVDPSPAMLAHLRSRAPSLRVVDAGFLTYDHAGPPADAVYSRYALHHLPDFWKAVALRRMHALLRPGGLFRLWDVVFHFGLDEVDERIESWCGTVPVAPAGAGEWCRADLEEHVRDEHSTFTWLLEPMLAAAGFTVEEAGYTDGGFGARYLLRA
jgi:SAM-dependent methyltransferase